MSTHFATTPRSILLLVCLAMLTGSLSVGAATTDSPEVQDPGAATTEISLTDLIARLDAQQQQLDTQQQKILAQDQLIDTLRAEYRKERKVRDDRLTATIEQLNSQRQSLLAQQNQIDQILEINPAELSQKDVELRARLESLEQSIESSTNAADTQYDEESFPGAFPVPGTSAALKIGGFVKSNYVQSFSAVGSTDRFIVGTIPTDDTNSSAEAALTVQQSRLNFDLRDRTEFGPLRAFIEGDFAGAGDTFRLRHAFGQFRDVLVGKTFSTFMDTDASPEEIDFEGINGRINLRQAQVRYFPQIGRELNLMVALEDPRPEISAGIGLSQIPDLVFSIRRTWWERWHVKTAAIIRNFKADPDSGGGKDTAMGWGLTVSGKTAVTAFDNRNDNLLFQFNYGDGLGRYVNDLGTIGENGDNGKDAIFDPNDKLQTFKVFSTYLAFQKWWKSNLRSTFIGSYVDINNFAFEAPDAYDKTFRLSGNLIFSPTARIDLGGEAMWGKREDKNGDDGTALQMQVSAKYRF